MKTQELFPKKKYPGRIPDDGEPNTWDQAALYYGCQDWSQVLKYRISLLYMLTQKVHIKIQA